MLSSRSMERSCEHPTQTCRGCHSPANAALCLPVQCGVALILGFNVSHGYEKQTNKQKLPLFVLHNFHCPWEQCHSAIFSLITFAFLIENFHFQLKNNEWALSCCFEHCESRPFLLFVCDIEELTQIPMQASTLPLRNISCPW